MFVKCLKTKYPIKQNKEIGNMRKRILLGNWETNDENWWKVKNSGIKSADIKWITAPNGLKVVNESIEKQLQTNGNKKKMLKKNNEISKVNK